MPTMPRWRARWPTDGRILLATADVDGATCLRACIVNHRTTEDDIRAVPAVLAEVAAELADRRAL